MSKSYDNTISLFGSRAQLQKQIAGIVTDSRAPGQPKDAEGSAVFQIYQAFASPSEAGSLRQAFADGIGWGDAKQRLFERLDSELSPMRDRYQALVADPARIEATLALGAQKARAIAAPLMSRLRQAVGLRPLQAGRAEAPSTAAASAGGGVGCRSIVRRNIGPVGRCRPARPAAPIFKQYRERDGKFYFKLVSLRAERFCRAAPSIHQRRPAKSSPRSRHRGLPHWLASRRVWKKFPVSTLPKSRLRWIS
jgi:tryptophanyl-tRNA synthetase